MPRRPERVNVEWRTADDLDIYRIHAEILMDIRAELRQLNKTLGCYRARRMSDDIHRIDKRLRDGGAKLKGGRNART